MVNEVLMQARAKLVNLNTVPEITKLLAESIDTIQKASNEEISSFKYPLAALLIEFYLKCPEAVFYVSEFNRDVSDVCHMIFSSANKNVVTL